MTKNKTMIDAVPKRKRLHELLGCLGNSQISVATFRKLMAQYKLTDTDIDDYCRIEGGWTPPPDPEGR